MQPLMLQPIQQHNSTEAVQAQEQVHTQILLLIPVGDSYQDSYSRYSYTRDRGYVYALNERDKESDARASDSVFRDR